MIGYFPQPYEDEIYYSLIARYHFHSGNISKRETLKELTGKVSRINIEKPIGLDYLVSQVSQFSVQYNKEFFINNHTMIPLVKPFNRKVWIEDITNGLEDNNYNLFLNRKDDVMIKNHLYYCSNCLEEQLEAFGEAYWKRIHQIPGVFVCNKHQSILIKYPIDLQIIRDIGFILPKPEDIKNPVNEFDLEVMDALMNLTEDVEYILKRGITDTFNDGYFSNKYITLLEINGIAYPILDRQRRINELILEFYPRKFLELLNSNFQVDNSSWLRFILGFRGSSIKFLHPIRHLLIMRALCGSVQSFFEIDYKFEPFGKGPWICMNPLAEHYLQNVVEKVEITNHKVKKIIQGDMICSCGFVYRLREGEKSPLEVQYFNNRIMKKGDIWERKIDGFLKQKLTINEISKRTKMTRPTIRKFLRERKNVKSSDEKEKEKLNGIDRKTREYREMWINFCLEYPNYTRIQLSNLNRAVYAWLRKYDKKWIADNSPESNSGRASKTREYSKVDDLNLLSQVQNIIIKWPDYENNSGKWVRKTKNKLKNLSGLNTNFENIRKSFPLTADYIENNSESLESFRKRKIKTVLEGEFKK